LTETEESRDDFVITYRVTSQTVMLGNIVVPLRYGGSKVKYLRWKLNDAKK